MHLRQIIVHLATVNASFGYREIIESREEFTVRTNIRKRKKQTHSQMNSISLFIQFLRI